MRLYRIPFSTNVERVTLALAYKGLDAEPVDVDPDDRAAVEAVSGQPLVPVLEDGNEVTCDSGTILQWLEERHPDPPLYPRDPARRGEAELLVDWFNQVWKRPPNLIAEERAKEKPNLALLARWGRELTHSRERFEALLSHRDFLLGDEVGIFDVVAFPFLKYAARDVADGDGDPFHVVLRDHLATERHPRLLAWIHRVDRLPRRPE
jgi:glutathione S-transferase